MTSLQICGLLEAKELKKHIFRQDVKSDNLPKGQAKFGYQAHSPCMLNRMEG